MLKSLKVFPDLCLQITHNDAYCLTISSSAEHSVYSGQHLPLNTALHCLQVCSLPPLPSMGGTCISMYFICVCVFVCVYVYVNVCYIHTQSICYLYMFAYVYMHYTHTHNLSHAMKIVGICYFEQVLNMN